MKETLDNLLRAATNDPAAEFLFEAREEFGHYTTAAAMRIAKEKKENPRMVAEDIIRALEKAAPEGLFDRIEVAGPGFVNVWLSAPAQKEAFERIARDKKFGMSPRGAEQEVIVEFSSANVGKQMHVGHLRNNSIGEALSRIYESQGYKVIRWNYLGDWGTQFGKIISAYKMWGDELDLSHRPTAKLEELYVRFNQEAKGNEAFEAKGKEEFRKLEEGDKENRELWNRFRTASVQEIEAFYRRFGIRFDEYIGESFFEEMAKTIVKRFLEKGIAEFSEGAVIVDLEKFGLPPALIQKSDGTSIYLTRDIAALEYRVQNYHPKKLFYVVGNEQTLSFEQLFAIAGLAGLSGGVELKHVKHGLVFGEDRKKMSTREGRNVAAEDLADEAVRRVRTIVNEKNPDLPEPEQAAIAEIVGLNALKYFMLHEGRMSDIVFSWDKALDFKGESGPYLQYAYARFKKLLLKGESAGARPGMDVSALGTEHELRLIRKLFAFPEEIRRSAEEVMTNNLTKYLYELANLANRFYEDEHILTDEDHARRGARLLLVETAARVLARGLELLGIEVSEAI